MMTVGAYSHRRQKRYLKRAENKVLVDAICSVLPLEASVIDLGCGCGHNTRALAERGYAIEGVDGTEGIEKLTDGRVHWMDLTRDCGIHHGHYDWAIFTDVGEHISVEFEQAVIDNVSNMPNEGLIVSWGEHGERGLNHVNCRSQVYVAGEFVRRGWDVNDELTHRIRTSTLKSRYKMYRYRLSVFTK